MSGWVIGLVSGFAIGTLFRFFVAGLLVAASSERRNKR